MVVSRVREARVNRTPLRSHYVAGRLWLEAGIARKVAASIRPWRSSQNSRVASARNLICASQGVLVSLQIWLERRAVAWSRALCVRLLFH
eukprot:COSAG01_NODE_592_length_15109_cov_39.247435_17_plen_90_part_00